jgi:hypothetical protein
MGAGLRGLLFKNYCIYFRLTDDTCRVVRVLHTRQNIGDQSFDDGTDG